MAFSSERDARRLSLISDAIAPAAVRARIIALLPKGLKDFIKSVMRSRRMQWLNRVIERQADRQYGVGKKVTSPAEIRAAMRSLPLPDQTVVLIHSAMSKIGYVE